jgi:hypothetical protein
MPETDKRFWQMFEEKQFSETFGMFPEEWLDNFWLKTPIRNSSSFSSDDDKPETEEERVVHVLNHPHVIPFLELRKNVIVAVCPNEQWFLDNPDESRENFWLAKILSHHYSQKSTHNNTDIGYNGLPIEPTILLNVLHFIISLKILKLLITVPFCITILN